MKDFFGLILTAVKGRV